MRQRSVKIARTLGRDFMQGRFRAAARGIAYRATGA
jgi:hypothetical protein